MTRTQQAQPQKQHKSNKIPTYPRRLPKRQGAIQKTDAQMTPVKHAGGSPEADAGQHVEQNKHAGKEECEEQRVLMAAAAETGKSERKLAETDGTKTIPDQAGEQRVETKLKG